MDRPSAFKITVLLCVALRQILEQGSKSLCAPVQGREVWERLETGNASITSGGTVGVDGPGDTSSECTSSSPGLRTPDSNDGDGMSFRMCLAGGPHAELSYSMNTKPKLSSAWRCRRKLRSSEERLR